MAAAAAVAPSHSTQPWTLPSRGKAGILALILTESSFFSIFVAAYIYYIGKSLSGPYPRDVLSPPIINTICLLSSSVTIVLAVRALRMEKIGAFALWWLATLLLALEFLTGTAMEWHRLIYHEGLTIRTNLFGTTYYSLVGLHALHVTVGMLMILTVMLLTAGKHVTSRHAEHVELLSWYWHFVDAVWIVVFLTVYIIGR
jgi:cytochrome c oxidase subunit III